MQFDDQLRRFFGTDDMAAITPAVLAGGQEKMRVEFALERDGPRRFALWALMAMLDCAPDPDTAFPDPADRNAARAFMDMIANSL